MSSDATSAADFVQALHLQALVEYDGTDYCGFQIQVDKPTIQGELENVLARLAGKAVRIQYAGRTDTGVHALEQVIAMRMPWRHSVVDLERALNALLPKDIAVREVRLVAHRSFHPRYSALGRRYRYTVWTAVWRSPLHSRYAHHEPRPLDVVQMNRAAALLLGEHDFASFGQPTQGDSTVRVVHAASWRPADHLLHFDIEANAFLRRMVRTVVGSLLEVGLGQRTANSFRGLIQARDRALAAPPAPACGLCLMKVIY